MALVGLLLKDFVSNLRIVDTFGSLRYKWNESKCRLELKSSTKIQICNWRLYVAFLNLGISLYQIILTWKVASLMVIIHSAMLVTDYFVNFCSHYLHAAESKEFVKLFNSFIEFEERRYKKSGRPQNSTKTRMNGILFTKYLMQMMAVTGILMPILANLDIIRNPCWPSYVGYWLSDRCQGKLGSTLDVAWTMKESGITVAIALFSYFNWSFMLCCYSFQILASLILQGYCMKTYISKFGSAMRKTKTVTSTTRNKVMEFRELQIFAIHYRLINSSYFLGFHTFCLIIVGVICLYNTIIWAQNPDASSVQLGLNVLYLWCSFVTIFITVFIYGILADVYKISKQVEKAMNCNEKLKTDKWLTRFLKTCPPIRVFIGGSNFLDELTPLTLEDFVISQTVSLLLMN
ncbi:unnamed protein product [Orchesella dallaii]|uniref:Gustatory receptor n=1 Tax=Orchesella dallaii TaxID=48710 RepID=A0ABP1RHB1_9HEXA